MVEFSLGKEEPRQMQKDKKNKHMELEDRIEIQERGCRVKAVKKTTG